MTTNSLALFARVFVVAGLSALSLAACAVESSDGAEPAEATEKTAEPLIDNGGGPGNSFACDENDLCTCDKEIAGDCEGMRSLCTPADLPGFDACMNGWLVNACVCHAQVNIVKRPPIGIAPIVGSSSGVIKAR